MKIKFSKHAEERMTERRISKFLVELTVSSHDAVEDYKGGGKRFSKVLPTGDRMTVGVVELGLGWIMITTVFIAKK